MAETISGSITTGVILTGTMTITSGQEGTIVVGNQVEGQIVGGPQGPAGPNEVTTSTSTNITGLLKGNGSNVAQAVEDTDYQGVLAEGAFVDGDKTKLDGIEALADVTDAMNVAAAGATMDSDTSLAGNGYFLDEDDMASDSATKVPSQQSVKAYVDAIDTGTVDSIVAGNNIDVDATDPANPIVSVETLTLSDISDVTATATEVNVLDGIPATLTATELGYVDGVTSSIQTQLNAKIENLSSFTTDDLAEGTTNLYSQWEENTYNTIDVLQPKDPSKVLLIGADMDTALSSVFTDALAIFNGDPNGSYAGTNYFVNVAYGASGFIQIGGAFIGGRAAGTPSAPTSPPSGSIMALFSGSAYDQAAGNWALSTPSGVGLPGIYVRTDSAMSGGGQVEYKMYFGGLSAQEAFTYTTSPLQIEVNASLLDQDFIVNYDAGESASMDGATGDWTFSEDVTVDGTLSTGTAGSYLGADSAARPNQFRVSNTSRVNLTLRQIASQTGNLFDNLASDNTTVMSYFDANGRLGFQNAVGDKITLYSNYKFAIASGALQYSVPSAAKHSFIVNSVEEFKVESSGATVTDDLNVGGFIYGERPYAELAKTSSAQQDLNATSVTGTEYYISWDSQVNVDTGFTHSTSTNNTRITVANAGRYEIKFNVRATSSVTNRAAYSGLMRVNGGTARYKGSIAGYARGAAYNTIVNAALNTEIDLSANDYIEVGVRLDKTDDGSSVLTDDASCQVIIRRID